MPPDQDARCGQGLSSGICLAVEEPVHTLEARFYPRPDSSREFVVVGIVNCNGRQAWATPLAFEAASVRPFDPAGLLTKLRFLVASAFPDPVTRLLSLNSQYWSFVEILKYGARQRGRSSWSAGVAPYLPGSRNAGT